ncbi:unnamed protein product [Tilletia controversa]|nr:unnamed protein product [Tilletia controversa]
MHEYGDPGRSYQMPLDGSAPPSPAGSAPASPAKSGKFSWGFGRKSRTPSPNASIFAGRDDDNQDGSGTCGRKASASPSSFVVKSVIRQPGGVSLDAQSPSSPGGTWSASASDPSQQFGADAGGNVHNNSYQRQKSRPVMSLGVPAGGPGGGVGYGGAHSSNDGRPEAEMRYAAATNAGALSFQPAAHAPRSPPSSPTRPASPGGGISAQQFQRKVRDRQNSIQNLREQPRQASPVIETRRAADIAADARASSRDAGWTREPDVSHQAWNGPGPQQQMQLSHDGRPLPPPHGQPFPANMNHASGGASPISIPNFNGGRGGRDDAGPPDSPFGTPSPYDRHSPAGPGGPFGPPSPGFDRADGPDPRGRSSSPGFAGLFKGIFGRSPKVDQNSALPSTGMYDDEHAWMQGDMGSNAPYDASRNSPSPSAFHAGAGAGGPPVSSLIIRGPAPAPKSSIPSPLRFGASGLPPTGPDPDEEEAARQKRESMLQARRIIDQERHQAIDDAVQRKPSTGPDSPWSPRQVVHDMPLAAPPGRGANESVGKGVNPAGRKPVPRMGSEDERAAAMSSSRKEPPAGGDALSRLESMLTPAQRIIQETRSRQLAQERADADKIARATVAQANALSQQPPTITPVVQPATPQHQTVSAIVNQDKGKARQVDPPTDDDLRNGAGEIPVRRGSKKSPTKQVRILAAPTEATAPSDPTPVPSVVSRPAQAPAPAPAPAPSAGPGSRTGSNLMPGAGPLPKDMTMTDALQLMMVRFYRFERYSIPLLRFLETRLVDIERDAQIALHQTDALSLNSARDREMDLWVGEMTGMMKHEIGQLRAACQEIKEGREIVAEVAQRMKVNDDKASEAAAGQTVRVVPTPATAPKANPSAIASTPVAVPASSGKTSSEVSDVLGSRKVPGSNGPVAVPLSAFGTASKVALIPATLKAVPRPDVRSASPSSITADPGLGVSQKLEPQPFMVPVSDVSSNQQSKVPSSHPIRHTNISSASFQSTVPILPAPDRDILSDFLADVEVKSPSVDAAARRAAAAALPAADRRSPSPTGKARPRYTSALGGSVLDSTTRTRSPERAPAEVLTRPIAFALQDRADSPGPSEADTSRSTQSVENRLKALLRGPESAAAVLEKSPTMAEAELEKEVMMGHATSPPVTEHLRWRSKESGTSEFSTPDPTTPNGASFNKESFFSGFAQGGGRATPPPLSSSPDKAAGVFGLAPNRHLKGSSSSSLGNGIIANATVAVAAIAPPTSTRSGTMPLHTAGASSSSGSATTKGILRNPSPTRLNVASMQPVLGSPSKQTTSPADYAGVPQEKADSIKTATHASDTLRARAASYLKASAATEPVAEGLSPKPGSWASPRLPASAPMGDSSGTSSSADTAAAPSPSSASSDIKTRLEGLPGGSGGSTVRSSTWMASDSTNTKDAGRSNGTGTGTGTWGTTTTSQFRRASNSNAGAVGANATLKQKLAFFDAAR